MRRVSFSIILILAIALVFPAFAGEHSNDEEVLATGTFTSGSSHGSVAIVLEDGVFGVRFGDNFYHEGSPDPWVALGKDGFQRHGIIGFLEKWKGSQLFPISDRLNARDFNEVYIWCVRHNSSLGRAKLNWK